MISIRKRPLVDFEEIFSGYRNADVLANTAETWANLEQTVQGKLLEYKLVQVCVVLDFGYCLLTAFGRKGSSKKVVRVLIIPFRIESLEISDLLSALGCVCI